MHAEDLAVALARLHARPSADAPLTDKETSPATPSHSQRTREGLSVVTRPRSSTGTIVYDPEEHGHSPLLPAIAVEDTSASPDELSPMEEVEKKFMHTARPPVELMDTTI